MKQQLKKYYPAVILLLVLLIPTIVFAQGPPDPNDIPIDGGLSLLLAAGAAYGAKKYRDYKKHAEEEGVEK
ncbi:MAG TPA: hypothetical protein PK987_11880 [Ferruginibacter sp.]|nr:hypothetical protein [Ferruginibacter sp.]